MPGPRFTDQVIFVTGGASGLGAEACVQFIAEGAKVFIMDIQENGIIARLGETDATFHKGDVGSPTECEAAVAACIERHGKLDVLFSNAAQPSPLGTVPFLDVAVFQSVINTNLCALFYLARVAIPQMKKQGKGVIVVTSSYTALGGEYGLSAYVASKAGVQNMARAIALDHARDNIRVNVLCPGYMPTPMAGALPDELVAVIEESIPMGKRGDPVEVAKGALFLASDDSSYMTGQSLVIDGGWSAHGGAPNMLKYVPEQFRHDTH